MSIVRSLQRILKKTAERWKRFRRSTAKRPAAEVVAQAREALKALYCLSPVKRNRPAVC